MKTPVLLCLFLSSCLIGMAQNVRTVSNDNYVKEAFNGVFIEMPGYRETKGGSKINVEYKGDWPVEMQGAFEYAVKMWEEVLPMTIPILIQAEIKTLRSNVLSNVSFDLYDFNGEYENKYSSPLSLIKGVLLKEYHTGFRLRYYTEINDLSFLKNPDMTITFNEKYLNKFDFSLDGGYIHDKYDFITEALRDIALGLGFSTNFRADVSEKRLLFSGDRCSPFEYLVLCNIGLSDPYQAFNNATGGSVELCLNSGNRNEYLSLYAPETWINGTSLRYFIPGDNPLTQLLTYDFGKGYVMRDLSGVDWNGLFESALDWTTQTPVGSQTGEVSSSGNSEDVIPYTGLVSLSFDNEGDSFATDNNTEVLPQPRNHIAVVENNDIDDMDLEGFCRRYDAYCSDGPAISGLSLSVMKKDGTWECLMDNYYEESGNSPITFRIEDMTLSSPESEYARGVSGGLRYRLTKCKGKYDTIRHQYVYDYTTKYFTRDFTPQIPKIKYSPSVYNQDANGDDMVYMGSDYGFVDVPIGIANMEGTTKVVVEQLDEGEELPFQYEVEDFRSGYFIANLDRDVDTELTVVSYNDNGFSRSNTIFIPAIGYDNALSFLYMVTTISVNGLSMSDIDAGKYRYSIDPLSGIYTMAPVKMTSNIIPVRNLNSGFYVLKIFKDFEMIGSFKFQRI